MLEHELRDALATQIQILEAGLVLLEKEKFVPNELGTRGFIDLFARDAKGHFVLIELKRSDAAAREAIHEVLKYVEGVKVHLGVRDHEIRVFVVSTTWKELLIPFSRFVADSAISARGISIAATARGRLKATNILPVKTAKGRVIAPWHELNFYKSESALKKGLRSYENSCKRKQIEDFILVILDPPAAFNEAAQEAFRRQMRSMAEDFGEAPDEAHIADMVKKLDQYSSAIYFGMQMLDRDSCLRIISIDEDRYSETQDCLSDMEEEEALCFLHETVYDIDPRPYRDGYEIGYPAKFKCRLLEQEGWTSREVRRFGVFSRNKLITDEALIDELAGSEGTTGQRFKRRISVNNVAHLASARTALSECLEQNDAWRGQSLRALDEIAKQFPDSEVDINIFNPSAGVMTLFFAASREDGVLYVPNLGLTVYHEDKAVRLYYGCLVEIGEGISFQSVVRKYYDRSLFGLLFTLTWGGYEGRDTQILEDFGFAYRTFRCDIDGDRRQYFAWQDDAWRATEFVNPLTTVFEFLAKRPMLVTDLRVEIGSRWNGAVFQDDSIGENKLKELVDLKEGLARNKFWMGDIDRCDMCGHDFANDIFMVDAATKHGPWACMCSRCFVEHGADIGWGKGQLYKRTPEGWLLVGGFGPKEEELEQ